MAWIVVINGVKSTVNRKANVLGRPDRYIKFAPEIDGSFRIFSGRANKDITHKFNINVEE